MLASILINASRMAMASTRAGGYQCEFMEAVPEDFRCGVCSHVAREAQLVSCCTEVFCKTCIAAVFKDKKPCPLCEAADYCVFPSAKAQKKILALDVRCTMKDRGCEWTGKLEDLEAHLDVNAGDCEYICVECPNKCGQHSLKDFMSSHLADSCPKRDFTCQYCNFKASYEVVRDDHLHQCSFYPVPCPNACGIQAIERGDLEAHLLQCPLEEVECEFNYAGCSVKLSYEELQKHMKENVQHHLVLMSKTFRDCQEQLQKQTLENKAAIKDLQKHMQICSIYCPTLRVPYYAHRKKAGGWWHGPPLYTCPGGYKFRIAVHVQGYKGAYGTHITASMDALKGEFDGQLLWPAKAIITLQLLNQERDQGHLTVTRSVEWPKPSSATYVVFFGEKLIRHEDLEYSSENRTRYLHNDSLFFRVRVEKD